MLSHARSDLSFWSECDIIADGANGHPLCVHVFSDFCTSTPSNARLRWPSLILFSLDPIASMQYQLVLQFGADAISNYDALIAIESQLIAALGEAAMDGHDMGSGEANIFLSTSDPQTTFRQIAPLLERTGFMAVITAAYRRTDEDEYHVLWPQNSSRQFSVA